MTVQGHITPEVTQLDPHLQLLHLLALILLIALHGVLMQGNRVNEPGLHFKTNVMYIQQSHFYDSQQSHSQRHYSSKLKLDICLCYSLLYCYSMEVYY